MFTPEERCTVRDLLLKRAHDDEKIIAAALTGSGSRGAEDRWSDVDLYLSTAYAKGADALPSAITTPLEEALVASLDLQELSRALPAAVTALLREVDAADPDLSARLRPALQSLAEHPPGPDRILP